MKVIDLDPIKQQIVAIDEQIKRPEPTPPVGTAIVFYKHAVVNPGKELAAVVTQVLGPGKVTLSYFPPNAFPCHSTGARHVSYLKVKERSVEALKNQGVWDYPAGTVVPKSHNDLSLATLNAKRDSLFASLENATKIKKEQEAVV